MLSYSKKITVKAKSSFLISLSQGNQLPISCMSCQKWFTYTQALCFLSKNKWCYRIHLKIS